ncbi:FkbM family methyltransferase [Microvirga sp. Marseille-Q2068]|uniref:FkbM family methyltransferase n=2 Tax=Microvirga mediterraneensis TaxID=2754695 RepID=A0A838BR56_9HYPH|nr:FkbM family methyltransferase [Microvirga mediterraneensis]
MSNPVRSHSTAVDSRLMNDSRPFGDFAPSGLARWVIDRTRGLPEGWAGRRVALMLRRLAMKTLKGVPLDLETFGLRMRLYPYKNVCERRILFTPQYFDVDEIKILTSRIADGFTFIDIGSNVGWYALSVAREAGAVPVRILAVEPQPEIFDRLIYNIRQNPSCTIKAVDCAVADKTGELTLFLDPLNRGEASLKIVNSSQTDAIRVPAVTMLELLSREGLTRVDAIKLDVEGAEDLVLDPFFRDAPASLYPSLFIVANVPERWQIDVVKLLKGKGYRQILKNKMNLAFERG